MRQLIYIPVIHTQVDMGSMGGSLKEAYLSRYGEERWASHVKAIEQMWDGIKRKLGALVLDPPRTKLYQDGLPLCGKELEIVTEVAARGSRNHQILLDLVQKGCVLIGTESPQLLVKEYRQIKEAAEEGNRPKPFWERLRSRWQAQQLLLRRDRFIARRIAETLREGETGLLFMGIQHGVDRYLPNSFSVRYLFHRLPFQYTSRFSSPPPSSSPPKGESGS
ncbi:MAG: hypothetical protein HYS41_04850 [Candidatus Omnitrophica bacterium]|nr:hypothetical protein [Candidatus Omnitrophota bacterium]